MEIILQKKKKEKKIQSFYIKEKYLNYKIIINLKYWPYSYKF